MPKNTKTWKISREENTELTLITCPYCGSSFYYDILKDFSACPNCKKEVDSKDKED